MFEGKWDKTTGYKLFKIDMQAVEIGLKKQRIKLLVARTC